MRSHTKKLLLWFTAFVLIMACVPGIATPPPASTLDANAINTYIAQTANVAAVRTASVPTLTATATLRNTSTPEPTYTLVGTLIPPTPLPVSGTQYFRVKHDSQLAQYNYKSRTADPGWPNGIWGLQTTEVVPLSVGLDMALGTHRTTMDGTWGQYIDMLNDYNKKKISYVKANNTALFNGAGFPQMESLTMGGNIITLDEIRGNWGRVHTFDYRNPGTLKTVNYITNPDLIHKFVIVGWKRSSKATYWSNPPHGDLYWPLVSSRPVWIPMEYLEPFPILPMTVTISERQDVRKEPSLDSPSLTADVLVGHSVTVINYHPGGSDVWGQLSNGGWIELLAHRKGLIYYPTSWSMATLPPIAPAPSESKSP
jgi:hypothetical protein